MINEIMKNHKFIFKIKPINLEFINNGCHGEIKEIHLPKKYKQDKVPTF